MQRSPFLLRLLPWLLALFLCPFPQAHASPVPYVTPAPDGQPLQRGSVQIGGASPFAQGAPLLEVSFLDINRGDAIFLRLGEQTLLIDGGRSSQYDRLEAFLLEENGSLALSGILNTHEHDDHVEGQMALIRKGGSAACFYGPLGIGTSNAYYRTLLPLLKKNHIPYARLMSGMLLQFGGSPGDAPLTLLTAQEDLAPGSALLRIFRWNQQGQNPNAKSLVIHLTYGERSILFTADITGNAQRYYEETYGTALAADILKAPHHGVTPVVPIFLEAVNPSLLIVTNEPKNTPKMNAQITYNGYAALFSGVGAIRLCTDGERWYATQDGET